MSWTNRSLIAVLLLFAVLLLNRGAVAHEIRPAYLQIDEIAPNRFDILWKQPTLGEVAVHLEPQLSNGLLDTAPTENYAAGNFRVRKWQGIAIARNAFDGARLRIEGLEQTMTDALVNINFASGQQLQALIRPDHPTMVVHLTGAGNIGVPAYLALGIEHILTGFDHLSFVLCLLLLVPTRRSLLQTITAFTLAHSLTLALTALGFLPVSAPVIEALVALSIIFVALEVMRLWQGHGSITSEHPWLIAFAFGLLHGCAFAGSLADIGLPAQHVPAALFLFNLGVEVGQLIFVALALAIGGALRRSAWVARAGQARWLVPYGVGTLASFWMFERLGVFFG